MWSDYATNLPKFSNTLLLLVNALKACAVGSNRGRTVTSLPGHPIGFEAQDYAQDVAPINSQSAALLAFHMCGVFTSVHANSYFDLDGPENPDALYLHQIPAC